MDNEELPLQEFFSVTTASISPDNVQPFCPDKPPGATSGSSKPSCHNDGEFISPISGFNPQAISWTSNSPSPSLSGFTGEVPYTYDSIESESPSSSESRRASDARKSFVLPKMGAESEKRAGNLADGARKRCVHSEDKAEAALVDSAEKTSNVRSSEETARFTVSLVGFTPMEVKRGEEDAVEDDGNRPKTEKRKGSSSVRKK